MPTIESSKKDLEKLIGKKFTDAQLENLLMYVKGEIDGREGDILKIDVKETNRPDLWSSEGIAREISARIGKEKGVRKYKTTKSKVKVTVDKNLEKVRPLIACAVIKNVKIDNDFIIQMVQLQEKVGEGFGRKRKETGIGIYDFDIMTPPVYYKGFKDKEIEFIPLEWKVPMRPSEILQQHEKGKAYKHLLEGTTYYPIVIDSKKVVASMPPIINSQITGKVSENTKNLFIEVTGFSWEIVSTALEVMCMSLADRGGKIQTVEINFPQGKSYPARKISTPQFKTKKLSFNPELFNELSGLNVSNAELKKLLERARYNVLITKNKITVEYPSYRQDILHPVDVVEDGIVSYGYGNIKPEKIEMNVIGKGLACENYYENVRDVSIGLGLQEVLSFNMTSKQNQEKNMLLANQDFVEIANPLSENYEIFRKLVTPNLLQFIAKNKNQIFPQRLFEIGSVLSLNANCENGVDENKNLCAITTHSGANFTEIKSILVTLCDTLGLELKVEKKSFPFLGENSAEITVGGKKGFIGELSTNVEKNFGLKKPVALFEFEL